MLRRKLHSAIFKTKESQACRTGVLICVFKANRDESEASAKRESRAKKKIIAGVKVAGKGFFPARARAIYTRHN